jgi:hypothetical protein
VLKWFDRFGYDWQQYRVYSAAVLKGRVQLLKWMHDQGAQFCSFVIAKAVQSNLDVCEYLYSIGCLSDAFASYIAYINSNLAMLKWLHEHGCAWDAEDLCCYKRPWGNNQLRDYLISQTPEWRSPHILNDFLGRAATSDNIPVAEWLRQRGAEWPQVLVYNDKKWCSSMIAWARKRGRTSPRS